MDNLQDNTEQVNNDFIETMLKEVVSDKGPTEQEAEDTAPEIHTVEVEKEAVTTEAPSEAKDSKEDDFEEIKDIFDTPVQEEQTETTPVEEAVTPEQTVSFDEYMEKLEEVNKRIDDRANYDIESLALETWYRDMGEYPEGYSEENNKFKNLEPKEGQTFEQYVKSLKEKFSLPSDIKEDVTSSLTAKLEEKYSKEQKSKIDNIVNKYTEEVENALSKIVPSSTDREKINNVLEKHNFSTPVKLLLAKTDNRDKVTTILNDKTIRELNQTYLQSEDNPAVMHSILMDMGARLYQLKANGYNIPSKINITDKPSAKPQIPDGTTTKTISNQRKNFADQFGDAIFD